MIEGAALMRAGEGVVCDLFITLVHGTWPRSMLRDVFLTSFCGKWPNCFHPEWLWFADGSEFRNRLTAALSKLGLSTQISPFLWSGANSVWERDKAARELVEHIRAKQSDYPSSTQVVIAHSHGGNVALRALDQLGGAPHKIFIATIATPFVEIVPAKLSPRERRQFDMALNYLAMFMLLPLALLGLYITEDWHYPAGHILIASVFALFLWLLQRRLFANHAKNATKVDELVRLTSLSSSVRKHPILVLRAVDR